MLKVHVLKILLSATTFMASLDIAQGLSAEGNESLSEALPGVDLEKRRERLKNLGRLYSQKYNMTMVKQTLAEGDFGNATEGTSGLETEDVTTDVSNSPEPSLEVINEKEGMAEYLFDGDINLTE
ncbi:unnamed protein product [Haemonchus placei]|uniref:RxLR effector protein n=1 Tax=Haemonchus placei TaxID=6290 RepID=A0A0N4WIS5_HAEPC|nr:unnamed protein product [Haemonchus placei]